MAPLFARDHAMGDKLLLLLLLLCVKTTKNQQNLMATQGSKSFKQFKATAKAKQFMDAPDTLWRNTGWRASPKRPGTAVETSE